MTRQVIEIDSEYLIYLIEQQPVIWDQTLANYKRRNKTLDAWNKVLNGIKPDYENLPEDEKQSLAKLLIAKWTHIRDSYFKSLKKQRNSGLDRITKPYIYSKQLYFLEKLIKTEDPDEPEPTEYLNVEYTLVKEESEDCGASRNTENGSDEEYSRGSLKRVSDVDLCPISSKKADRHMSFFAGIAPSLESFDEDKTLEFQMGVLQLIRSIKSNRRNESIIDFVNRADSN